MHLTRVLQQQPTADVLFLTVPTTGVLVVTWLLEISPTRLLGWAFVGTAGLIAAIKNSRNDSRQFNVTIWPRKRTRVAVSALAYNGVLIPSIAIAQVAWAVTGSFLFGVLLAFLAPIWFLKHIHFILTLSTSETG
jgi:hypothetical protein